MGLAVLGRRCQGQQFISQETRDTDTFGQGFCSIARGCKIPHPTPESPNCVCIPCLRTPVAAPLLRFRGLGGPCAPGLPSSGNSTHLPGGLAPQVRPPGPGAPAGEPLPPRRGGLFRKSRGHREGLGMESGGQSLTARGSAGVLTWWFPSPMAGTELAQKICRRDVRERALARPRGSECPSTEGCMGLGDARRALAPVRPCARPGWGDGISLHLGERLER